MCIFCAKSAGISYQLEIGKLLLTFRLNIPVIIRTKLKKCEQFTNFALMMTENMSSDFKLATENFYKHLYTVKTVFKHF